MIKTPRNFRDLRLYIDFDGAVTDKSPYNNDGTWNGSTSSRYVAGKYSNAGTLNGTDDYVSIATNASLDFTTRELTLMAWIYLDVLPASNVFSYLFYKTTNVANDGYYMRLRENDAKIDFAVKGDLARLRSTDTVPTGQWVHIAATYDGVEQKIYKDGILLDSKLEDTDIDSSTSNLGVGGGGATGSYFDGKMDEARIYGKALSANEIQEIYLATAPSPTETVKQLLFQENFKAGKIPNDWVVSSGSYAVEYDSSLGEYYLECLTAGVIGIPVPQEMQDLTEGGFEWEWDMYQAGSTVPVFQPVATDEVGTNGYRILFKDGDDQIRFNEVGVTFHWITASSFINFAQWYTLKVTRDSAGEYTSYSDGTLIDVSGGSGSNPVTHETTTTTTRFLVMDLDAGDRVKNIAIRRF